VRSTLMVLSFLLALLLDREKDLYDALLAAAFLILAYSPAALFDISFQLSFLSVFAILYLMPRFDEYLASFKIRFFDNWGEEQPGWKRKAAAYLGGSLLTSAAAILGTGPLVSYYFNRFSLVGFVSNLVLVPIMGFANTLLSLMTALLVFLFEPLAKVLTAVNVFLLDICLILVDFFSRFPSASKRVVTPSIPEMLLMYGMMILAFNLKRWRRALPGLMLLLAVYCGLQVYEYHAIFRSADLKVTFLDVGQADAAVVFLPRGKVMVIDGGGSLDGSFDPGERIVAPYLWKMKRNRIDYLVNSHPHPDHLQGLIFLLENFEVGAVWHNGDMEWDSPLVSAFSESAGERAISRGWRESDEDVNGVRIASLHPPLDPRLRFNFQGNNGSLTLRLHYDEVGFLFPGDIEAAAEEEILKTGADLRARVIKVPHHGSRSSSTPPFLDAVRPEHALFTVRARNRLPHPAILERYEKAGAKIHRSDRDGAVTFTTNGKELRVDTFLK
ncbi:MAG TPA: ComEC/Rec2 family competence protein, partial [Thermodesulfobacteriota bacterium]|nr:ComEC/Rec2 family competence protein [Thermodesulfobacteriota bacterium]